MIKTFKLSLIALAVSSVLFTSCDKKDDADKPDAGSKITLGDKDYSIKTAVALDQGADNPIDESDTHYGYTFIFTDGTINSDTSGVDNAGYLMQLYLYSPGTDKFRAGTFEFVNDDDLTTDDANKYFCDLATIGTDTNGDNTVDESDDESSFVNATAGSVTVSGTAPNYTVKVDLTMDNSKKLSFTYSGKMPIIDVSGE